MIGFRSYGLTEAGGAVTEVILNGISETMSSRVEQAIRKDIVSGDIAPGTRLRVAQLSAKYGVSPIPVREALRQLEGDRLVVIDPHKGAILRGVTRKFVIDMHDMRAAIEALLVENASRKISADETVKLRRHAEIYEEAVAANDAAGMVQANRALHRFIAIVGDNPEAARIQDQGWELVVAIRKRYGFGENRITNILEEHRLLVDAIASGDCARAVEVARHHCAAARDDLVVRMPAE
ncbi:GntR family transcriptional regulator [Terrihabitans sp. B22-R8]|uniref:GntR family transcriptional regulator n=1 Tax=Terrihabitans sp. B22-R8 TaxID=3425128 RepID=UPI00403D3310